MGSMSTRTDPARAPRQPAAPRFFVGRRPLGTEVLVVTDDGVEPLRHHGRWSRVAFEWGYPGAGGHELAFAILATLTGRAAPRETCRRLARDVLMWLPLDGFVLPDDDIEVWLELESEEPLAWPPRPRPSLWRRLRRPGSGPGPGR